MLLEYIQIFYFLIFSILLSILIYSLSFFLIVQKKNNEKLTAYECGFNPYGDARTIFDVRFYLIAILFIIFDLETAFIFPWIMTLNINFSFGFWTMIEFLIELSIGFIYIWSVHALEWN
jgi:NADH:ubiquinone oxidoreductase subunit 3 (subunit A)